MTVKDLWAQYQHHTRDITEHGRKLGFAGAAICWLFKSDNFTFPTPINWALLLFVAYFVADLAQGFLAAWRIKHFAEGEEQRFTDEGKPLDGEIEVPDTLDKPAFRFFIIKCVLLSSGFFCTAWELIARLSSSHILP